MKEEISTVGHIAGTDDNPPGRLPRKKNQKKKSEMLRRLRENAAGTDVDVARVTSKWFPEWRSSAYTNVRARIANALKEIQRRRATFHKKHMSHK